LRYPLSDMIIPRPRGTRDFLPQEAWRRNAIRRTMQGVLERWGYQEIATPTFEHLELFTLKSGDAVVEEIYSFKDKGGRDLALRPELTAPVMRMYVSELHNALKPLRLCYFGNCFRYERPQRGRFREFWQMGAELIGGRRADSEAEVVALAYQMLEGAGVKGDIHLGHLGLVRSILSKIGPEHRSALMRMIDKKEHQRLKEHLVELGADHLGLLELINLKGDKALEAAFSLEQDLALMEGKGESAASTSSAASAGGRTSARTGRAVTADLSLGEFAETVELLKAYGVETTIDFEIVRGLEYYSGTVFEIYASGLGAQSQICGGGTYELASLFGGQETSSTGFGLGFDRIMEIAQVEEQQRSPAVLVYTPDVKAEAIRLGSRLRKSFPLLMDVMGRGLGAQLKHANAVGADFVIIVGESELAEGKITLRNMRTGEQEKLSPEKMEERLAEGP
jgi:histidyl-tRNA synthetase